MPLVIFHVSDIHLKSEDDLVLQRTQQIASALFRYLPNADAIIILATGDIAFSGLKEQYEIATKFLHDVVIRLKKERDVPIYILVLPGNHDCDFTQGGSVRDAVLAAIKAEGEAGIDSQRIQVCMEVQKAFIEFRTSLQPLDPINDDPLWTQYKIEIAGKTVSVDCLNVSWMSQRRELPGSILFPTSKFRPKSSEEVDLRVVGLHHPLNWFHQASYHGFRSLIRNTGHLVITGHEHVQGAGEVNDALTQPSAYIEGAALQPHSVSDPSGFNVVEIDLGQQQYRVDIFQWSGEAYTPKDIVGSWSTYRKLPEKSNNEFSISEVFIGQLDDPGANFSHPAKQRLCLSDFYIYPDLEEIIEDGEENRLINSTILRISSSLSQGVVLKGAEKSGKTALLKSLYRTYHESGRVPVLIYAQHINSVSERELQSLVEKNIAEQYSDAAVENWRSLPASRKILLLDDLDRCHVADRYRGKLIGYATSHFGHVVVTTGDILDISETVSSEVAEILGKFVHYEIQPFGYKGRYDLITKWGSIGEQYAIGSAELIERVDKAEKIVNSVFGKNLVPRVPIYLLTLLQSLESSSPSDIQASAFGHYYQYLITQALRKINVRIDEMEEFFHYCSSLSWVFHQSAVRELDIHSLREFNAIFSKEYVAVDLTTRLDQLCRARLMDKRGDYYSFSYPYIYYYFLGKYISEHLSADDEIRHLVEKYCAHLYVREFANTILFLTHHCRDGFVIDQIVQNLQSLFADKKPICLEADTSALNELVESTSRLVFSGGDPQTHRRTRGELQDNLEGAEDGEATAKEVTSLEELDLTSRLNMLFKTVEILGQILKNYYGTLRNDIKMRLMREIYRGPLRALRGLLEEVENNRDGLIKEIETLIESKNGDLDAAERTKLAQRAMFEFVSMITFGFLHKASSAVGSEHLSDVSKALVAEMPSNSFRLIALGTRLDTAGALPFDEIEKLAVSTESNIFAHRILEATVLRHMYFFKSSEADKQRLCSLLGVSMKHQRSIDLKTKGKKLS